MADPLPRYAKVDQQNPEAFAMCDRCGHWYNRSKLAWQTEWTGTHLYNTQLLVCTTGNGCWDIPQEQFRTIILPPDPPPILNARVPDFAYEEQTTRIVQFADPLTTPAERPWGQGAQLLRCVQNGEQPRILQYLTSS